MQDRQQLLSRLKDIQQGIQQIIGAQERQVKLVNDLRQEELIQHDEYQSDTITHKLILISFRVVIFSIISSTILLLLQGVWSVIPSNLILIVCAVAGLTFLMSRYMNNRESKWIFPAIIFVLLIFISMPIRLLLTPNVVTIGILLISLFATFKFPKSIFDMWVDLINGRIRSKNDSNLASYENSVAYNNTLKSEYNNLVYQIDNIYNQIISIGEGWYPVDYYTLHAVNYFINCLENYKADTVKEMVQLYDTYLDRQSRRAYESQMIALQQEQLINQERMIGLLQYANIQRQRQISLSTEIAQSNNELAKAVRDASSYRY